MKKDLRLGGDWGEVAGLSLDRRLAFLEKELLVAV